MCTNNMDLSIKYKGKVFSIVRICSGEGKMLGIFYDSMVYGSCKCCENYIFQSQEFSISHMLAIFLS